MKKDAPTFSAEPLDGSAELHQALREKVTGSFLALIALLGLVAWLAR